MRCWAAIAALATLGAAGALAQTFLPTPVNSSTTPRLDVDREEDGLTFAAAAVAITGCPDWPDDSNLRALFWAEDVDGSGNSTLTNLDPITTWVDLGTLGQDLSGPGSGGDPAFVASCVNGRPCARFDGGDRVARAAAEASYLFMVDGTGSTIYAAWRSTPANPSTTYTLVDYGARWSAAGGQGATFGYDDAAPRSDASRVIYGGPATFALAGHIANDSRPTPGSLDVSVAALLEDAGGTDSHLYTLGAATSSSRSREAGYPTSIGYPLAVGRTSNNLFGLVGDIYAVAIYAAAHDATTRAAFQAKIECHLDTTLPVSP